MDLYKGLHSKSKIWELFLFKSNYAKSMFKSLESTSKNKLVVNQKATTFTSLKGSKTNPTQDSKTYQIQGCKY